MSDQVYEVIKKVTLPLLSLKEGDIVHVRFDEAAKIGKKLKGDASKKEPAHLAMVTNLDTGEEVQMIMPAVLRSTLEEEYPDSGQGYTYVKKCFEITHLGKKGAGKGGKSLEGYNIFKVVEVNPIKQPRQINADTVESIRQAASVVNDNAAKNSGKKK